MPGQKLLVISLWIALALTPMLALAQDTQQASQDSQTTQSSQEAQAPATPQASDTQQASPDSKQSAKNAKDKKDKKDTKDAKDKNAEDDVDQIGERDVSKGMNFYSLEQEIALGKQLATQVEQQSRLIDDPVVSEYVNRVGQNIVRNSDAKVPFTIKVIDDPDQVNAFALPGGFFFVYSGLILETDTEAELAGVMAHETAHVAARHVTRNASKAELANWMTLPLIFLGGPAGLGARGATSLLLPMKFLQFSRSYEREADFLGLQYMYKAGYDPNAFVEFFEKLEEKDKTRPGTIVKAFSTHPPTPDRIEAAENEIKNILPPREEYVVTTGEFDRVKARLRTIENRGRINNQKDQSGKPTLRRKTTASTDSGDSGGSGDEGASGTDQTSDDDGRPTLKRRGPDSDSGSDSTDSGSSSGSSGSGNSGSGN